MSNIHVIAHTHWDQEWYFTLQDSNIPVSYTHLTLPTIA